MDLNALTQELEQTITTTVAEDANTLKGFSQSQLRTFAEQAEYLAKGIVKGEFDEAMQQAAKDHLSRSVQNFVHTLVSLTLVTMEKLYNALVKVLWQAIGKVTGIQLV